MNFHILNFKQNKRANGPLVGKSTPIMDISNARNQITINIISIYIHVTLYYKAIDCYQRF